MQLLSIEFVSIAYPPSGIGIIVPVYIQLLGIRPPLVAMVTTSIWP